MNKGNEMEKHNPFICSVPQTKDFVVRIIDILNLECHENSLSNILCLYGGVENDG
jgi:hypothetical protein